MIYSEKEINEEIQDKVNDFLHKINTNNNIGWIRNNLHQDNPFQMFSPANVNYYDYKYHVDFLESNIKTLITNIICIYLCANEIECNIIGSDVLEFVFTYNTKRIGVAYNSINPDNAAINNLLNQYDLENILIIDFSNYQLLESTKKIYGLSLDNETKIQFISAKQFFSKYLNNSLYESFYKVIKNCTEQAKLMIGMQTIPQLSKNYIYELKISLYKEFMNKNFQTISYIDQTGQKIEDKEKRNYQNIYNNAITKKRFLALLGKEDFAVSYFSS